MEHEARVRSALERSVLPLVIARGGGLRVIGVEDGVVDLEATGSPGATLPLLDRIERLLRSDVPDVRAVRIATGGEAEVVAGGADLAGRVRAVLDAEIDTAISAHRGHVALVDVDGGWVRIRLEGGCQGCSLAEVTVRQGIEPLLRQRIPEIVGVMDVTDHPAGREPYFTAAKR